MAEDHDVLHFAQGSMGWQGTILTLTEQDLYWGLKAFNKAGGIHILGKFTISNLSCTDIFHNTKTVTKCTDTLLII